VLLAVATAAGGCSWTENDTKAATYGLPDLQQSLMAHVWELDAEASTIAPVTDAVITLEFADDVLSGNAPCNSYTGGYSVGEDTLTVDVLASTLRACVEQDLNDAEAAYLAALEGTHDVDATDRDRLVLERDGTRLEYRAAD